MTYKDPSMVKSNFDRFEHDEYFTIDSQAIDGLWYYWGDKFNSPNKAFDVWEPACGAGHISEYVKNKGLRVYSSDLNDFGYGLVGRDFLTTDFKYKSNHIITNPPYIKNISDDFVERAISYVSQTGGIAAFLLRTEWCSAHKRYKFTNEKSIFSMKIVLQKRPYWIAKEKSTASPRFGYSWYVWDGSMLHDPMHRAEIRYYHPDLEND